MKEKAKAFDPKLTVTEELDFHYLLTIMPALYSMPEYSWLPELFCIVGHEKLIELCKYAGGETIQIPTLDELSNSVEAMQWYYDVDIKKTKDVSEVPAKYRKLVKKIEAVVDAE